MEFTKTEMAIVKQTEADGVKQEVRDLSELQLALVGGGSGDIVWG